MIACKRWVLTLAFLLIGFHGFAQKAPSRDEVLRAMKRATAFMVDTVSYRGGFLWNYAPDFSRVWGELEAKPTMMWMDAPGGSSIMGHTFLDAYHATGDEFYYQAAVRTARAIIWAQHPDGGWHYLADFAGEASVKDWYKRVYDGYDWPAYEHQYYYGNCTYDDGATILAANFLLRMYVEKYDPEFRPALDRAIDFVLNSQYPIGGWPQRYPLRYDHPDGGPDDYTSFITINDGVHTGNINFLITCYQTLGEQRVLDPITRAMTCILALQGGNPQAGWGLQHRLDLDLLPAHARPFEPDGYASHGTQEMIEDLFYFYRLTGNTKYLARIPDAFAWLESIRIPESDYHYFEARRLPREGEIICPTFVEIGTNKGLYLHREPGDIRTADYWVDYNPTNLITHYSSIRTIRIDALKKEYEYLISAPVEEVTKDSPLKNTGLVPAPKYFIDVPAPASTEQVARMLTEVRQKSYWGGPLPGVSSEYVGFGPDRLPSEVISTNIYSRNMMSLISFLDARK